MEKPVIQLKGLTKCYGSLKAVDRLDLTIHRGEIFGLLGPNGAGKTTTILMMLGLTEPTSGSVTLCGHNATTHPLAVKKVVGYMPDNLGFYANMTALDNLLYIGRLNAIPEKELHVRARHLLEVVGLTADASKKTSAFSRGMKQRLGLAEVLLKQPEVIILDEPTLGIDPAGVRAFLTLIRQLSREQGLTVLLSSHHLHQVQQVCDRVGIFVGGKMLAEGSMDTLARGLFGSAANGVRVTLTEPVFDGHAEELRRLPGVEEVTLDDRIVEVACSEEITPEIVRFFVGNGLGVTAVQPVRYGLDDIYQTYFETKQSHEKPAPATRKALFRKYE